MKKRTCLFGLAASCLFVGLPLQAANIVQNPGFETGDLTNWNFTAAPGTGCSTFGVNGTFGSGANTGSAAAQFGSVCSGAYDTISQDLATTAGTTYTFTFWLASDDGGDNGQQVYWDGNLILNLVNFGQAYTLYSFTETASSNLTTISFAGYNTPAWNSVDDVSVDANTAAPEPSTMLLFGAGAAVLVARRRKSQVANQ